MPLNNRALGFPRPNGANRRLRAVIQLANDYGITYGLARGLINQHGPGAWAAARRLTRRMTAEVNYSGTGLQLPFQFGNVENRVTSQAAQGIKSGSFSSPNEMSSGQMTSGYHSLSFKVNPDLRRVRQGKHDYVDMYNIEQTVDAGTKKFILIAGLGVRSQYMNAVSQENMVQELSASVFDLLPDQNITASGNNIITNTNPGFQYGAIESAIFRFDFINLTTLPVCIKIAWYKSVDSANESVFQVYDKSAAQNKLYSTDYSTNPAIIIGGTTSGNETNIVYTAPTASTFEQLETHPYTSLNSRAAVARSWEYLKGHKFVMQGGDNFNLNNYIKMNAFQTKEDLTNNPTDYFLKGSIQCIMEVQGLASHVVVGASGPQPAINEPTYAPARIGLVINRKITCKALHPTFAKVDSMFFGQGSVALRGAATQMSIVNDDLDVQMGQQTA